MELKSIDDLTNLESVKSILGEGEFVEARFTDRNYNNIISVWYSYEEDANHTILIPVNLENGLYQRLLEDFNLKQIKDMTNEYSETRKTEFLATVKLIAENQGLIYDPSIMEEKDEALNLEAVFSPTQDIKANEEFLFDLKLRMFDMEQVIESDKDELKKQLREAETPLECFYILGKILYE